MAALDIIAKTSNTDFGYIPSPVAQFGPVYNYEISAYDAYKLMTTYPQIWLYDSTTKEKLTLLNFNDTYPDFVIGNGGGGYSGGSGYTKAEIDDKLIVIRELINNLDDKINLFPHNLIPAHYEKNTDYVAGKLLWIEPGNLYQVTEDYTSSNESTTEASLINDVNQGKLVSIAISSASGDYNTLYNQVNQLSNDVLNLQNRMAFASQNEFPEEGNEDTLYIDRSTGKSYIWNADTEAYQRLDEETLDDINIIQSGL